MKDLWLLLFIVYKLSVKLLFKLKLIKGVQYGLIGFVVGKDQSNAILVGCNRDTGNAVRGFDFFVGVRIFLKLIELYSSIVIFFASAKMIMAYIVSSPPVSPRASAAASMFFSIFGASVSLDLSEELLSLPPPQAVNARSRTMERRMVMIFFIMTSSSFEK